MHLNKSLTNACYPARMDKASTVQILDAAEITMPVQWGFKNRQANGAHIELLLRRVKHGNETACEDIDDCGFAVHLKGRFSDAQTLDGRLRDAKIPKDQAKWMQEAMQTVLEQMAACARQMPALVRLFAPKGKLEIYGPETQHFAPQYISGNFTLKIHSNDLKPGQEGNLFLHLIAQHLDYPFAPGERRFSTSRLFDMCFLTEKVIAPAGLAAAIDRELEEKGIFQPDRQQQSDYEQVQILLDGHSAAIRTSYERVLQRERFASFIRMSYSGKRGVHPDPILKQYRQLVEVDLLAHDRRDFTDYPPKNMDSLAESMHIPLAMIFVEGKHGHA